MFDYLKPFKYIFVTGPQRAGTTITSKIIAHELDYHWYEAGDIQNTLKTADPWQTDIQKFIDPYNFGTNFDHEGFVAQCPYLSSICGEWRDIDGLAVVMVKRPVEDIIASQERIGWGFEELEKDYYPDYMNSDWPIAKIKYNYWHVTQKHHLTKKAFEVEYDSLSSHPLFVSKEQRKDFWSRQTEIGKPLGERIQRGGPGIGKGINEIKS